MGELRDSLRGSQTDYRVLKNTLTGIAASEAGFQELLPLLDGPTAVAFVHGDPVLQLATLESRQVMLARLAGVFQASLQRPAIMLAAPLRQVATMTTALRDRRQEAEGTTSQAEAAAAPAPGDEGPAAEQGEAEETTAE